MVTSLIPWSKRSVVIRDLDLRGVSVCPSKADSPLIVDPDAHLSCPSPLQGCEPIARWITQVVDGGRGIELTQLAKRSLLNVAWELAAPLTLPDLLSFLASERSNHRSYLL
jgi:hypothetical protein